MLINFLITINLYTCHYLNKKTILTLSKVNDNYGSRVIRCAAVWGQFNKHMVYLILKHHRACIVQKWFMLQVLATRTQTIDPSTLASVNENCNTGEIMTQKQKIWSGLSLATEYTWRSRSWRWHSTADPHKGELKDLENKCIVATKQLRGVHKDTIHQPQNTNTFGDTTDNTTHMVFEGEPAVKLQVKNIEVGTSANGNPRKEQVTLGTVHSPWSTNMWKESFHSNESNDDTNENE